jgi:hypothetical protein
MPVNIYIQDEDLDDIIEFYNGKLKAIKQKKIELEKEEKSLRITLIQLKSKKDTPREAVSPTADFTPHGFDYSDKWTWAKKIEFALKDEGKPLSTTEIVDVLAKYEPDFEEGGSERRKAIASISSTLSVKSGLENEDGKDFIKIEDGTGRSKFIIKESEPQEMARNIDDKVIKLPATIHIENDDLPF